MKIRTVSASPISTLPRGFYYISQDNYHIANLNDPIASDPEKYLYSDSATSCVIVIAEGKNKGGDPIVALSHMSRYERFVKFFLIIEETFCGPVSIFAQGANPPQPATKGDQTTYTSLENAQTVINWVNQHIYVPGTTKTPPEWYIDQCTLSVGLGDPQVDDRGCYGIDLSTMIVSNQRFNLTAEQRDPTGGVQTLFCVFGLDVTPQIVLPESTAGFTDEQVALLVEAANKANWTSILYMTKDEVLNKYSSTPQYEVPWFFESLRSSAEFVANYNKTHKKEEALCAR